MSVQTVRPSALPLPKSLSSSTPSVSSSGTSKGPNDERPRAGSSTPPSNGPMSRSTIPVLYNPRSVAMIPRVAAAGLPHKNSHKTVGIPNGMSTSININIKKPLSSPTSQPNSSYWRFGQSKGGSNITNGSREIIRRHSARASVDRDSGNVTPQQQPSPLPGSRKISTASSTTDNGSRKISTCSTDSAYSSNGRKISSESNSSVTSITKSHRKPVIGASSFGAADTKSKKRRSVTSDNREKDPPSVTRKTSSASSTSDKVRPKQVDSSVKEEEVKSHNENDQSISKDSTNVDDGKELSTNISLNGPPAILEETNTNEIVMKETASNPVVPSPNTSTTITVKTKGKNFLPRVLV